MILSILASILAVINGDQLIEALIYVVVWGVIMWVLWWGLNTIAPPEPWKKVGTVLLVLITVLVLVNILLGIGGHPIIRW